MKVQLIYKGDGHGERKNTRLLQSWSWSSGMNGSLLCDCAGSNDGTAHMHSVLSALPSPQL